MNKFFHSVYLQKDLCKGCVTCMRRCPTGAIRVRSGKARIIPEFCIDCGECVRHCPHHAKQILRDDLDVLKNYRYTVALPAPSLYSQFNNLTDVNVILSALLEIGFDDVFEVSVGAEKVSAETRRYVADHPEKWPLISTACPTIERLIRVRFPNLIGHLLPILSPVEAAAKMARRMAVEKTGLDESEIGIIFLSPCPSKITFIKSPLGIEKSNVDAAVAVKDIYPLLLHHMNHPETELKSLSQSGRIGIGWGISGGEAIALNTDYYLAADGIENVIRVLEDLEDEKFPRNLRFIELDACSGGCVGGVLNVENPYIARSKVKQIKQFTPLSAKPAASTSSISSEDLAWDSSIDFEPVYQLGSDRMESMEKLSAVEELMEEFPGLNCGACGAPTCRALAEDVVTQKNGAKKEDCIYLLRDYYSALKKSQLLKEEENDNTGSDNE